jgi:hypothetical protein
LPQSERERQTEIEAFSTEGSGWADGRLLEGQGLERDWSGTEMI